MQAASSKWGWTVSRSFRSAAVVALGIIAAFPTARSRAEDVLAEVKTVAFGYHRDPTGLFTLRASLESSLTTAETPEKLIGLAWLSSVIGGLPSTRRADSLAAYDRGRELARRAITINPSSAQAHFWYAVNTARWAQMNGIFRSLVLLPTVRRETEIVLELAPDFVPAYSLAGSVYSEVPALLGGDLKRAERLFRTGLVRDPHDTGIRLGLAKTLLKQTRDLEALQQLQAVLVEPSPHNPADWTLKDTVEAQALLNTMQKRP
jgi:hypothetical protein